MSLYIFGKLVPSITNHALGNKLLSLAESARIPVKPNEIDEADLEELMTVAVLTVPGVAFTVRSDDLSRDATMLWLEVTRAVVHASRSEGISLDEVRALWEERVPKKLYDTVMNSRLGHLVSEIIMLRDVVVGGLALVDGGIDEVYEADAIDCRDRIMRSLVLTWDASPNALYVWRS